MPRVKSRSSRRAPVLGDDEYDHEIALVDHADEQIQTQALSSGPTSRQESPETNDLPSGAVGSPNGVPISREDVSTTASQQEQPEPSPSQNAEQHLVPPVVSIQAATPLDGPQPDPRPISELYPIHAPPRTPPEIAIDVLYENQRGGFLCGFPLFSSAALGNLDPPAWTNSVHKPSPTNTHTAQVPDPSWEWVWPEWHINMDDGVDSQGWEYSFMFARRFSWHGAAWWNSFVRRRAWTRERKRRASDGGDDGGLGDAQMLGTEYFTVRSSADLGRASSSSRRGSIAASTRSSVADVTDKSMEVTETENVTTSETLLRVLRKAVIDREKIEAVQSYLEHTEDNYAGLEEHMHEIMGLFVFQASRRVMLTMLNTDYNTLSEAKSKGTSSDNSGPGSVDRLRKAIEHADEEVKKLEYWSDIKEMSGQQTDSTE